jgi:hypothetical protein
MADLNNAFIYSEMEVNCNLVELIVQQRPSPALTWVGFKDSFDAIEKYEILANGITVYTQNNAIEESFITNCASTDVVKKADIYSKVTHKNIWKQKYGDQCGTWYNWGTMDGSDPMSPSHKHIIKLKIDARRFLPLSNVKFLPAFAGKLELKLYFGTAGLVVANSDPKLFILNHSTKDDEDFNKISKVTIEFVQIGDPIKMPVESSVLSGQSKETITIEERIISAERNYKINLCEFHKNEFGLHSSIYEQLKARYTTSTLCYPTQIIQVNNMSNNLNSPSSKATATITPKFVDSIFLLFPERVNQRSVFVNPKFESFQLTCGNYGSIPSIAYGTIGEPRFVEMCSNAVNLNTDTFGLSEDVLNSIVQLTTDTSSRRDGYKSCDGTNFFIGIPTETDNTFQQGQTSDTPINYELTIRQSSDNIYGRDCQSPPLLCCLMDVVLMIQVQPYGSPLVTFGAHDITSLRRQ